jgi:hemoglobin
VRPTRFEFAGGERAFLALAAAHHARCLRDPELNHPVGDVLSYSSPDAAVPAGLAMPRWSWDGLQAGPAAAVIGRGARHG